MDHLEKFARIKFDDLTSVFSSDLDSMEDSVLLVVLFHASQRISTHDFTSCVHLHRMLEDCDIVLAKPKGMLVIVVFS